MELSRRILFLGVAVFFAFAFKTPDRPSEGPAAPERSLLCEQP